MAPVLLVTADPVLAARIERLAAAAGAELLVAGDGRAWPEAALVLVGADDVRLLADPVARRPGVVVVASAEPDASTWQAALAIGAEHVVALPDAEPWLLERFGALTVPVRQGRVLAVAGSAGGAGASTLACALAARAAARGLRALLVDADAHGGGLEVALGMEELPGSRWPDIGAASGRIGAATIAAAFPQRDGVAVVSHRRGASGGQMAALPAVVDAARAAFDLVVVDLPRAMLASLAELDADHWVVLAADRVRPVIAAAGLVLRDELAAEAPIVVLRRMRGPVAVDPRDAGEAMGARIDLELGHDRAVAEAGEHGDPLPTRGPVATAADRILDRIGMDGTLGRAA